MSNTPTRTIDQLDALAARAQNYRYAQAERNLADLQKFLAKAVEQKSQTQTQTQGA